MNMDSIKFKCRLKPREMQVQPEVKRETTFDVIMNVVSVIGLGATVLILLAM